MKVTKNLSRKLPSAIKKDRRTNFVYGVLSKDTRSGDKLDFSVRMGKFKFYNYLQELPTVKCHMEKEDIVKVLPNTVANKEGYAQRVLNEAIEAKDFSTPAVVNRQGEKIFHKILNSKND